jgi:cytochrome c5
MSSKNILLAILIAVIGLAVACNSNDKSKENTASDTSASTTGAADANNPKGVGPHQNVQLTHPLDEKMVAEGQNIYNVKCGACHKLTNEKTGWAGMERGY